MKIPNLSDVYDKKVPGHFETKEYVFFWAGPFSNWHLCSFTMIINNQKYNFNCSEQAMMLMKSELFNDLETSKKIMNNKNPKEQKSLGRSVKSYVESEWIHNRDNISDTFLYAKFSQNDDLKKILLDTGNKIIVEASPYDEVWGIKMGVDKYPEILDPKNWKGLNLLGESLMRVRDKLKEELE